MPRRLSIAFVVPRFHTNLYYAVRALTEAGHTVHLICRDERGIEDHSLVQPIYPDRPMRLAAALALLRKLSPDLLVLRDTDGLSRPLFWAALITGRRVVGYDQNPHYQRRPLRKLATAWLRGQPLRRLTPVLGLDRSASPDRFSYYVPFPVERPLSAAREYAPDGIVRILCIGKLSQRRKNHRMLLEVLASLKDTGRFSLTLVGNSRLDLRSSDAPYLESLMSYAQSGPLRQRITILADIPFRDMPAIYAAHDVCVLPAEREPLGTSPLEAMSYGCVPVISTDCGSAGYIDGKDCGFLAEAGDAGSLAEALKVLIEQPRVLQEFGARARATVANEFSGEGFVTKLEELARIP